MLTWSDDYKIGLGSLDGQHLILFSIINQIDINIQAEHSADLVEDVLAALASYIDYHFAYEEALMAEHGYPALAAHRAGHARLSESLATIARTDGDTLRRAVRIRKFAIDWLAEHILEEDAAFAEFVRAKAG